MQAKREKVPARTKRNTGTRWRRRSDRHPVGRISRAGRVDWRQSFGGLTNADGISVKEKPLGPVCSQPLKALAMKVLKADLAKCHASNALHHGRIRPILSGLITVV